MTVYLVVGIIVAVIGVVIGRTVVTTAARKADNPEKAARRRYAVLLAFIILAAALLIFDAVETPKHRYFNVAVVAIMIGGVAFDWFRSRRRRTLSKPPTRPAGE
jgi:xanthine/uracil permease